MLRKSSLVIAVRGGRVLAVRQMSKRPGSRRWVPSRGWSLPGGKVDPGEDDLVAARREFREETGAECTLYPTPVYEGKSPKGEPDVYLRVYYCLSIDDLGKGLPESGSEVAWVRPEELTGPRGAFPKFYQRFFDRFEMPRGRSDTWIELKSWWWIEPPVLALAAFTAFVLLVMYQAGVFR